MLCKSSIRLLWPQKLRWDFSMLISVIVPIYEVKKFLPRTIECLKKQTCKELEFLLVDDGNKDDTNSLLQSLTQHDDRFTIIKTEHAGYGHACNTGIAHASGTYIAIYEPDDVMANDFYACLLDIALKNPDVDVLRYNGFFNHKNGVKTKRYTWKSKYTNQKLNRYDLKRFWRSHPSVFNGIYKKEFINSKHVRFCETDGASYQDVTFMVSLFYAEPTIFVIDDAKYFYEIHPEQSVNHIHQKIKFVMQNWQLEYQWLKDHGYTNFSFFYYKMFLQFLALEKRSPNEEIKKIINQHLTTYSNINSKPQIVFSNIASLVEKLKLYLFCKSIKGINFSYE